MDEGARLVEVDTLSEPVKRAGVIVLDVDGQNVRLHGCGAGGNEKRSDA